MRKYIFIVLLFLVVIASYGYYHLLFSSNNVKEIATKNEIVNNLAKPVEVKDVVAEKIKNMTIDEKIGQLLIIGFENSFVDEHISKMIKKYHIGGINLLGRNIVDRDQTNKLLSDLQSISSTTLFLATDQEGGKVVRFNFLKELRTQKNATTTDLAYEIGLNRGLELKDLGINMNFAPVLDYVSNSKSYLYNRTFATTSEAIGNLGASMIRGYVDAGILPVAKHFPGYGNISPDPHKNISSINIDKITLDKFLAPFYYVVKDGKVDAIMTAHIIIPFFDKKPATLSSYFLNTVLREQIGFRGVIITDDIEMVSAGRSTEQIAVDSIKSGADMVISTYTTKKHEDIFNAIKKAVADGEISEARIDQSIKRILDLKDKIQNL